MSDPTSKALPDRPERDVIDLIKTGADFFYIGSPGDLERLSRTALAELRAENEALKAAMKEVYSYASGISGQTGDDAGHWTYVGVHAKEALERCVQSDEQEQGA